MGSHHLRHDKTCENCGYEVDIAYCSNCGQKNVETRQTFGHLVSHFAEDLTHYDAAFWKTIKYLMFRPGRLTIEYLSGKRQMYVPPVKLYIFISFLAFFIPAILPDLNGHDAYDDTPTEEEATPRHKRKPSLEVKEDVWVPASIETKDSYLYLANPVTYTSIKQMDSIEALKPDSLKLSSFEYKIAKGLIARYHHLSHREIGEKFSENLIHNIPKALFIYMPVFGFWLWLLHGKRRWLFFDHGIFTLHYFAFLLLTVTIMTVAVTTALLSNLQWAIATVMVLLCVATFYSIYYFYRGHRKMYMESRLVNFFKCTALFFINMVGIAVGFIILFLYTYHNIH